jgi:hypothetical protein
MHFISQIRQYKVLHTGVEIFLLFRSFVREIFNFTLLLFWSSAFLCGSSEHSFVDDTAQALLLTAHTGTVRRLRMLRRFDLYIGG